MSKKTKFIVLISSFCFIVALGIVSVFAIKNFDMNMGGKIKFVAPGIEATISNATFSGISKKQGSGEMQTFTVTRNMTQSQIADLSGVKSWEGISLLFDDDSQTEGRATITFTITNNSDKSTENIMVNLSTNTTNTSTIQATPSADFCIGPGLSHTFTINLSVSDLETSALINDFELTVELKAVKSSEIPSLEEQQQSGINFTTNSSLKTATFSSYTGSGTSINIPAIVQDASGNMYTVTEIAGATTEEDGPFYSVKSTLSSVTFPSTLTKIGDNAFNGCTSLNCELLLPNGVKAIGNSAFYSCSGLTGDLIIPNSVTSIGQSAFYGCSGFTGNLKIGSGLEMLDYYVFKDCTGLSGTLTIPDNIKIIGENAFYNCKNLSGSLTIPNSVLLIGIGAFYGCSELSGNLTIGDGVKTIGSGAFYGCSKFTGDLIIPSSVTNIGDWAFVSCSKLTSMKFKAKNPPILEGTFSLNNTGTYPIYVPAESVDAYKSATNWSEYVSRIFAIS